MNINNNKNLYILGAGFSVSAGIPTMAGFMSRMREAYDWYSSNLHPSMSEKMQRSIFYSIEKVLQYRLHSMKAGYYLTLELENIEELFSLASAEGVLLDEIPLAIAGTIEFSEVLHQGRVFNVQMMNECESFDDATLVNNLYSFPANSKRKEFEAYQYYIASMLGMFSSKNRLADNAFITFNYDLVVERALSRLEVDFDYCFKNNESQREANAPDLRYVSGSDVKLIKLHGSLNWLRKDYSCENESISIRSSFMELESAPELVPPTWKKILTGQFDSMWKQAVAQVSEATRIVIIGFSMPASDLHFKYLLAAGLKENISLKEICFVNPEVSSLKERCLALFGEGYDKKITKIRFSESTLDAFVSNSLSSIGRSTEYFIRKD